MSLSEIRIQLRNTSTPQGEVSIVRGDVAPHLERLRTLGFVFNERLSVYVSRQVMTEEALEAALVGHPVKDESLTDILKHAEKIGRNSKRDSVYRRGDDGRRFIVSPSNKAIYFNPDDAEPSEFFLIRTKPSDKADPEQLRKVVVQVGTIGDGVQRFSDVVRFASLAYDEDLQADDARVLAFLEQYRQTSLAGLAERFRWADIGTAFKQSTRFYDRDVSLLEAPNSVQAIDRLPPPISIVAGRIAVSDDARRMVRLHGAESPLDMFAFVGQHNLRIELVSAHGVDKRALAEQAASSLGIARPVVRPSDTSADIEILNLQRSLAEVPVRISDEKSDFTLGRSDLVQALEVLNRRISNGRSIFILQGPKDEEERAEFSHVHHWLGRHYAIEGCIDISPDVSSAMEGGNGYRILSVGTRRPHILDEAPEPALRVQTATDWSAVWNWTSVVLTSRTKISTHLRDIAPDDEQFQGGQVSEAEANDYQVPYMAMSRLGRPTTMIPRNMEASLRIAQKRFVERNGDVDDFVSQSLAVTKEHLTECWSAEQIDAIAFGIDAFARERGILVSDQTGVGKGRTLVGLARYAALNGKRVIYSTESAASFSDIVREIRATRSEDVLAPLLLNAGVNAVDEQTGEEVVPAIDDSALRAMATRRHWPDGSTIRVYTLTDEAVARLSEMRRPLRPSRNDETDEEFAHLEAQYEEAKRLSARVAPTMDAIFHWKASRRAPVLGKELYLLEGEELPDFVMEGDIRDVQEHAPLSNFVLTSYSQFNRPSEKPRSRRLQSQFRAQDRAVWLKEVCTEETAFITDESHNAASGTSHIARNYADAIETVRRNSGHVVYASATWAKKAKNMAIYAPLFPRNFPMKSLPDVLQRGGETLQETLSAMLVRDGVVLRREHDLSKVEFITHLDKAHEERNHDYADLLAPVLSQMAVLAGEVSEEVARMNDAHLRRVIRQHGDNEQAARQAERGFLKTTAFGSPLGRLGRLFNGALLVDATIEQAIEALESGQKPVILLESTMESVMTDLFADDPTVTPDFRHIMHRTLSSIVMASTAMGRELDFGVANPRVDAMEHIVGKLLEIYPEALRHAHVASHDIGGSPEERLNDEALRREAAELVISGMTSPDGGEVTSLSAYGIAHLEAIAAEVGNEHPHLSGDVVAWARQQVEERLARFRPDVLLFSRDLSRLPDTLPVNPSREIAAIRDSIDRLPDLPISAIDAIKTGIRAKGYSIEEITGRSMEIVDGELTRRTKIPKGRVKDAFNRGDLDAVILNNAGATAIDLHAGARFQDQRQRRLIVHQAPADIQKFIQALGRVRRYDQVIGPVIQTMSTGMPVELRMLATQNTKLRRMSANTNSSRENESIVVGIPDIVNAVGDRVVTSYLAARPELVRRLGLPAMVELTTNLAEGYDGAEDLADNKRSANMVIARIACLLGIDEQRTVMAELEAEYNAMIAELDAKGANPLRTKVIDGTVTTLSRSVFSGVDVENPVSEFDRPVFVDEVEIEHAVAPMRSGQLIAAYEKGLARMGSNTCAMQAERMRRQRDDILSRHIPKGMTSIDDAVAQGNATAKHALERFETVLSALDILEPGKSVGVMMDGFVEDGIITRIEFPAHMSFYDNAHHYDVHVGLPGWQKEVCLMMSTLSMGGLKVGDGLHGADADAILRGFDTAMEGASRERRLMLSGNDWAATETAITNKLGTTTSYRDAEGVMCRGILIHKKHNNLDFLPAPVLDPRVVLRMANEGISVYGSQQLKAESVACRLQKDTGRYRFALPAPSSRKFGDIYDNARLCDAVIPLMAEYSPTPEMADLTLHKAQKRVLDLPPGEAVGLVQLLMEGGVSFYVTAKARQRVTDLTQELYQKDRKEGPDEEVGEPSMEEPQNRQAA